MSSIVNKVKEAVSGHHKDNTSSSAAEGTYGTHNSRVGNAADPRIDSDRDHRAAPSSKVGGTHEYTSGDNYSHSGAGGYGSSTTGTTGGYDSSTGEYGSSGTGATGREGPHSSNTANKLDPRIDSDRSGARMGNTAGDQYGSGPEGVHGPHSSRIANAVDPRVDSDRDASRTVGNQYGSSGTQGTTGAYGTHGSSNTYDNTGSTGNYGTTGAHGTHGTHGTSRGTEHLGGNYAPGPAANTAGPHKSDALNKADPRVDSNLDGSKTYGGNKTYGADSSTIHKDPTDAAQVPPSTMQAAIGRPSVEHGDQHHGRERRHSLKTSQETHRGL
ncbi:hypothetical protein E0Z10_g7301 [Xylaria hypoxylon]|uniref:Cell surface protein n=1 Tax=Xylaria hypoxylon TaxID=37992 RepID=A0A4Z0YQZ1_9PEZI|nr:hypothetical protein E0Z10_g7301 [Xylaria hypoxylon]